MQCRKTWKNTFAHLFYFALINNLIDYERALNKLTLKFIYNAQKINHAITKIIITLILRTNVTQMKSFRIQKGVLTTEKDLLRHPFF
ncbi:hypothetical protein RCL_jg19524.t1 [Rhizophagus clarus]|uniref:Uncharacterized protein n=1 Tax=Rhizophagus clarus TaxID=94130 RepID=A0A8H3LE60_9GLOM|nr:hypothetical protein RCL_jg19524.t1 [Rhizophagus clarus]